MSNESHQSLKDDTLPNLIPLTEAAKISGFTPSHLRLLIRRGTIWGKKFGRDWFTTEAVIGEYMAKERRRGPKRKSA